jgi:type III pantothenate kinase
MTLALDFGNTRIKAGLFRGSELVDHFTFDSPGDLLNSIDLFTQANSCILGSVTSDHEAVISLLPRHMKQMVFTTALKIPLKNLYRSALTLGSDRLAASVGSWMLYPRRNVLTIDVGTCVKYNFVNANDEYIGGAISPGVAMKLKAMHHYTQKLPLVALNPQFDRYVGVTSEESILAGAVVGTACEIDGMVSRYTAEFGDVVVVLTGGDADLLAGRLKSRFFAHPHVLLSGLNHILSLNSVESSAR